MNEVRDYELRVYGISKMTELIYEKEIPDISDEEWVEEAENIGYISTLETFIDNVNNGKIYNDYAHLFFRVIPIGYYDQKVDIVPKNKLQYMIRD
tara:strand:+ start:562 stop:846 length:285 start_codon:yes stop_codon:yes gene_type:complete